MAENIRVVIEGSEPRSSRQRGNLSANQERRLREMSSHLTSKSETWMRNNAGAWSDERGEAKVVAGHHDAVAEGLAVDTEPYFRHLERHVYGRGAGEVPRISDLKPGDPLPSQVRLSKREREIAESLGISFKEYVRRRVIQDHSPDWQRLD